jgi:Mn2+/Fe2+ NRAMP family transporter
MLMQGAGLLAGLIVLFVLLPNGARLGRTNPTGQTAALFDALKKRQAIAGSIAGTLGLLAYWAECFQNTSTAYLVPILGT